MINGIGNNSPVQKIVTQPVSKQLPAEPAKQLRATDRLEVSGAGHLLKTMKASGDVRVDLVQSVKKQIEAGTYETEAKLNSAVDRLLEELG
ncbi:MAG TPA: flagellar biosynthesis anti-sigma factor FlgM [Tepidisphaeraceae bacterium]|jgi:anti-sigma28 factor (negative regulator of flagellin synthesis)